MTLRQIPVFRKTHAAPSGHAYHSSFLSASCAFFETFLGFIWINLDISTSKLNY